MEFNREISLPYGKIKLGTAGKQSLDGLKKKYPSYPKDAKTWKDYTEVWVKEKYKSPTPTVFTLNQVHGDSLHQILPGSVDENSGLVHEGDGLYTELPNSILIVRTADCVPVYLYSNKRPFVAIVHSGWKGTSLGITERMIERAIEFGFSEEELYLEIGPYIQGSDYEVEEDVANLFIPLGTGVCHVTGKEKFLLDVGLAIESRVKERFEKIGGIQNLRTNVFQSPLYFSHRAKEEGRNLNFILWES
ncbi:laccase domain-containing protein [Leptospira noumeaensis]|uniref:Laccase domain-containing protein n=1 Tax=Leptospira noumeaensis TaxID=2484964 RepID=A0A4R9IHK4_9LEPT|nr:polyphenol oxidase family protein [Leptospira noumeaensis]TGK87869.1 laccase domain-containing protein [Leptospira noumeaensis]